MFKTYLKLLKDIVALPSVSADSRRTSDTQKTATYLEQLLAKNGFKVTLLTDPRCNPVVVAKYNAGKSTTTLVYGHYDVQPAEISQGWKTGPFELTESGGRLYGRGSVDNKGQVLIHVVSILELIKQGRLAKNVTFLIEGNEETGNDALADLIKQNQLLLACDEIIISDGEMRAGRPTLEATLRGGYNARVQIKTGINDLHSGLAGGAVPSASNTLVKLLAALTDEQGKVLIKGFYDGVAKIDPKVETTNAQLARGINPDHDFGVKQLLSADSTDFYTQIGLYPTLQITGINTGYTGEGFANIVPAVAEARLNIRTVVGQDPLKSAERLKQCLAKNTPGYAELKVEVVAAHPAISLDTNSAAAKKAIKALEEIYAKPIVLSYVGGAVPVVSDFQAILGIDSLMIPLGNEDCNMHGANENFRIDLIKKGLEFSYKWFSQ